jgi:hypothetical protein
MASEKGVEDARLIPSYQQFWFRIAEKSADVTSAVGQACDVERQKHRNRHPAGTLSLKVAEPLAIQTWWYPTPKYPEITGFMRSDNPRTWCYNSVKAHHHARLRHRTSAVSGNCASGLGMQASKNAQHSTGDTHPNTCIASYTCGHSHILRHHILLPYPTTVPSFIQTLSTVEDPLFGQFSGQSS